MSQQHTVADRQNGPVADWRGEADRWWAGVLWAPETAIRAGGVFAASHLDHVGVLAVPGRPRRDRGRHYGDALVVRLAH